MNDTFEHNGMTIKCYQTASGFFRAYVEGTPGIQAWGASQDIAISKLKKILDVKPGDMVHYHYYDITGELTYNIGIVYMTHDNGVNLSDGTYVPFTRVSDVSVKEHQPKPSEPGSY